MTTAASTQTIGQEAVADDIAIVRTPPTMADAQLILQLQIVNAMNGADQGWNLLHQFDEPPTLGQLRKRHAKGGTEHAQVMAFLSSCETAATFVRQGILNEALVFDLWDIPGAFRRIEKLIKGVRREAGEPRIMENTEWLAKRAIG